MESRFHSVTLDKERCKGCSNCLMHCPTQAIRVRGGRAHIIKELCIDCGACIRVCPYHAKVALTDSFDDMARFPHKIALPAPSFYAQFGRLPRDIGQVTEALEEAGFDMVFEVARGADIVSQATAALLRDRRLPRPLISSACPAVTRLIQVRFPSLIGHLVPLRQPMEVAAAMARKEYCARRGVKPGDAGVFFITPCAAKMTAIRSPIGQEASALDGAIAITEIYAKTLPLMSRRKPSLTPPQASAQGVGWAGAGGEMAALDSDNALAVDGIDNVIRVLEEIENGKLSDLDFLEGSACVGGCLGGPLVYDNNYVAKNSLRALSRALPKDRPQPRGDEPAGSRLMMDRPILPNPVMQLDEDMGFALDKMGEMQRILEGLPGYDCGACGSPSCATFAQDIVQGYCQRLDCTYLLRESLRSSMTEGQEPENKR